MTTFGEAVIKAAGEAAIAYQYELGDVRMNLARAFLQSLEASGFKIIGPEVTPAMETAAIAEWKPNQHGTIDVILRHAFRAQHAAAPSVTDLLIKEQP